MNQSILRDGIVNGSRKFEVRIHELQDDLGSKPAHLLEKSDAPSLWGTRSMMGSSITNVEQEQSISPALQAEDIQRIVTNHYQHKLDDVGDKSDNLQATLITVSKHLKAQVLLQDQEIIRLSNEMSPANNEEERREILEQHSPGRYFQFPFIREESH